jgi:NodT family efflux transporter outer membrane factor (OMF) lipoprotein
MTACAVGPDFERPAAPAVAGYDDQTSLITTSADDAHGAAQTLLPGEGLPGEWWKLFQSEPLNDLITEALLHNPDMEAAEASLRAAEESVAAGEGQLFPTITGDFSSSRQKTSGSSNGGKFPGSIYTLHNASVSVSYGLDVFGGTRRAIEELEASRDYQAYQLEAAKLSLTSNVATAAIREASLRGQIAATQKLIEEQEKQLKIYRTQLENGAITRLPLLLQETTLAQTRASLPPLELQLAQTRHALSALIGQLPVNPLKGTFELGSLHLPEKLPISLPSLLVEQRPDIKAAEANLHAASAAIGVAEAARLPQFLISADIGSVANEIGKLFTPGGGFWSFGGQIGQTIFDAGSLAHKQGAAEAEYDAAAAIYRKTVLAAFQDVADTLRALEADAKTLQAQSDAERAASNALAVAKSQFESGSVSYLEMLDSENAEQKARIALVQAQAQRFADTAALFQALGGGWTSSTVTKETPK